MPHLSPTTLTAAEQRALLVATAACPRDHTIFSLALGTGFRLGEIVGLNVGDVFFDDGAPRTRVHLRREIVKDWAREEEGNTPRGRPFFERSPGGLPAVTAMDDTKFPPGRCRGPFPEHPSPGRERLRASRSSCRPAGSGEMARPAEP